MNDCFFDRRTGAGKLSFYYWLGKIGDPDFKLFISYFRRMHHLMKIFFTGMLVSFLGSLPLGTLNVLAMKISIEETVTAAMLFSLGSLVIEIVYVRLSLVAMDWVRKQEKVFRILEWVTLLIILALAIASFYAAMHPTIGDARRDSLPSMNRFLFGALMCAINPVQIPFWFGWSTVLFTKKLLLPRKDHYNSYIMGIGIGTFIGNCVFIFGGLLIASKIRNNQYVMNWIIGGIFAATALIQLWRIFKKKDAVHQLDHPEEVAQKIQDQMGMIEEGIDKITHKDHRKI